MGGKVVAHCLSAASTKRNVVLAGAALISVTFNSEYVLAIRLEPLRLLVQRGDGLRGEFRRILTLPPYLIQSEFESGG